MAGGGPAAAGAAAHVFVEDVEAPALSAEDAHHLERVLRLRAGQAVTVSDGQGRWRLCRFVPAGRLEAGARPEAGGRLDASGGLEPDGPVDSVAKPSPAIVVAFALTKGERPEWVVQKLTEVGVDRIVPFIASRTVVRWDAAKSAHQGQRLRAVARAAAMQSRRAWLPVVDGVRSFDEAVGEVIRGAPAAALAHQGGRAPSLERPAVVVGPEGGFSDDELACGLPAVDLGPTVLRAETAAVAAGVLLCGLRSGLVGPPPGLAGPPPGLDGPPPGLVGPPPGLPGPPPGRTE